MARWKLVLPLLVTLAVGAQALPDPVADQRLGSWEASILFRPLPAGTVGAAREETDEGGWVTATAPPRSPLAPGTPAPELFFKDREGRLLCLSQMRGKVVVLHFWGIDCKHCARSETRLNDIGKEFAGLALVAALDVEDYRAVFSAWLAKHPHLSSILFAVSPDQNQRLDAMSSYDVTALPETYVIDRNGYIVATLTGDNGSTAGLANIIRRTLKKQPSR